jgi:hypothetical protein
MHQLLQQMRHAPLALIEAHNQGEWGRQLIRSHTMLESAVKQSIASLRHVYLFIDGLDEFPADHVEQLMKLLYQMNAWMLPSLHVYVTSQLHGLSVRSTLEMLTAIDSRLDLEDVDDDIDKDILTYIKHSLEMPPFCNRWRGELHFVLDEIKDALVDGARGK